MSEKIQSFRELRVYQNAMDAAMRIFQLTKGFPPEEKYFLCGSNAPVFAVGLC
ncbi:MAG: four helix bundle protein [Candidatus Manganitrophaceae bacterium]